MILGDIIVGDKLTLTDKPTVVKVTDHTFSLRIREHQWEITSEKTGFNYWWRESELRSKFDRLASAPCPK